MTPRSVLTISAVAGLFGLYVVYALAMNAVIGVRVLETRRTVSLLPPKPPVEATQMAETWLSAEAPWARDAQYRVRSHGAFIYYQSWEHLPSESSEPDNSVRFAPFAVLWSKPSERPYAIVSPSARVKFARGFSLTSPDTGRVVGGMMIGDVSIHGPDGLVITGRDFFYSEEAMKIWSDYPVEFQLGEHRGSAGSIQIDVLIDREAVSREEFAIAGFRNLTLRNKVKLYLQPEDDSQGTGEILVECERTLDYDTETRTATFEKDVVMTRPTGGGTFDRLTAAKLKLVFDPAPNHVAAKVDSASASTEDANPFRGFDTGLSFNRLQALGPGLVLTSDLRRLRAEMEQLVYSQVDRLTILRDSRYVNVRMGETLVLAPEISIKQDSTGEVRGLQCDGAGELRAFDPQTGEPTLRAQWGRRLRVTPENDSAVYLIELERQAVVSQPEDGLGLTAEFLRLWVSQNGDAATASPSGSPEGWSGSNLVPQRMLAIENVGFRSENLSGGTRRLEIWFDESPAANESGRTVSSRNAATNILNQEPASSSAGLSLRQPPIHAVARPEAPQAAPPRLDADLIRVQVLRGATGERAWVKQVVTSGNVVMQQDDPRGGDALRVEGDLLEVENPDLSNERQIVHVYGKPARILNGDMSLDGNQLHLDRGANKAWVSGPGVMRKLVDSNLDGLQLDRPEMLNVWWKEQMVFDGRKANFFQDVRAQLGASDLLCQEMEVSLSRQIDFGEGASPSGTERQRVEIDALTCKYSVEIESRVFEESHVVEIRQGKFGELDYRRESGKTVLKGPGTLWYWKAGNSNRSGLAPRNEVAVNRPLRAREGGWEFLEVNFSGHVDGNLNSRMTSFQNGVEVIFGPVPKFLDRLAVDELPVEGGWIRSRTLDVVLHPKTEAAPDWVELRATGNVELEGRGSGDRSFYARADMLTYDESKKMYRLRTLGQQRVTFWQDNPNNRKESSRVEAKVAEFFPESFKLKLDGVTSFEGVQ